MEAMADTQIHEAEAQSERNQCGVCNMYASAPREAVVYADDSWTVTLGYDVPGWVVVMANRHNRRLVVGPIASRGVNDGFALAATERCHEGGG